MSFFKKAQRLVYAESEQYRTQMVEYKFVTKSALELEEEPEVVDNDYGRQWIESVIEEVIEKIEHRDGIHPRDKISLSLYGGDLTYPVVLPMSTYHSVTRQRAALLRAVSKIQQSKREWTYGVTLDVNVTVVRDLNARGKPMTRIMTPDLFRERVTAGTLVYANEHNRIAFATSEPDIETDAYFWMHQMEYSWTSSPDPPAMDTGGWMDRLGAWCLHHKDRVSVMVLHQPTPDSPHHVYWQSRHSHPTSTRVFWLQDDRLLAVYHPNRLYGKYIDVLCLECGMMYSHKAHHACLRVETPHSVGRKRRPHFRCTEKQRERKRHCRDNDDENGNDSEQENCLGRALQRALVKRKLLPQHTPLEKWYQDLGMAAQWNRPAGLKEVKEWSQAVAREYGNGNELVVYDETLRKVLGRYGPQAGREGTTPIFLNVKQHHFTWIKSMPAWLGRSYFCDKCLRGFSDKEYHRCTRSCPRCGDEDHVHNKPEWVTRPWVCETCNCSFWSWICFKQHRSQQRRCGTLTYTQCQRRQVCRQCNHVIDRLVKTKSPKLLPESHHVCFQYDCEVCGEKKVIRGEHHCYVKGKSEDAKPSEKIEGFRLAFFDFETRCLDGDHHEVNKVVVLLVCDQCVDHLEEYATRSCTGSCGRQRVIILDTIQEFMDWLQGPHHARWMRYTFLAHNLKGYDAYPILEECIQRGLTPSCIYQGAKVMTMTVDGVTFKDSVNFIPMALRKFPSTFGTSGGKKGFFPHFFNTKANANYVGPYPALSYYGYDEVVDGGERKELKTWWEQQQNETFDLAKELTEYCLQDVLVMARGCLKYRDLYVSMFQVDPFQECVTLASTCLKVFQRNFLPPNTLGVVPPLGYRPHDTYSSEALEWLYSLQIPSLQTSMSPEGEAIILGTKVDGYDPETRTVYQYHGCFFHGCDECYPQRHTKNPYLGMTMQDARDKTQQRTLALRRAGYSVLEKWSHEWDVEREQHPTPPRSVTRFRPLLPREALCGGRTNAIEMYAWCRGESIDPDNDADAVLKSITDPVHRIRYIDVVSLYPTVMKEEEYPVGHPTLLTYKDLPSSMEECERKIMEDEWFGLVKADVDPPRGLYFPVLPVVANHRLIFALCRTCVEQETKEDRCTHDDDARRWVDGVWTTFEVREALRQGYRLHAVHEVWHYPQRSRELFSGYIRDNLKVKMEASGWPARCVTDDDKRAYVEEVRQREGLTLEWDKVQFNPGLRAVAKLNLNSLWGKFGQNPFRSKTEYVDIPQRYFELIYDDTITVNNVVLLGNNMVQVTYTPNKESVVPLPYENVVLASCVTSYARLRLYAMLHRLGERVLYHDTDSVIYKTVNEGDEEVQTGSCLGQWEDECKDPDKDWLVEFVSLGPKSYAYRTRQGKSTVKCKGITFTPSVSDKLHIKSMKRLLIGGGGLVNDDDDDDGIGEDQLQVTYPYKIVRDPLAKQLKTTSMSKNVQLVYTKRQLYDRTRTLPFGY